MKKTMLRGGAVLAIGLALVISVGCVRVELPDPGYETKTETVDAGAATEVTASIDMGAGELDVTGGATGLMKGTFEYSPESWKPEVDYEVTGGEGRLSVRSPRQLDIRPLRTTHYVWDIALADDMPFDLAVNMGAGEADLDLRGVDVRRLDVNLGAGETTIDLSGVRRHDADITVATGAGSLTVRVPADVGVRIRGLEDGIGDFTAEGFTHDGDALVNQAYDDAGVRLEIRLTRGIGEIIVEAVE
jgi:hypothetical protein